MIIGDLNAKLGKEEIYKGTTGKACTPTLMIMVKGL
jgi:hypothetical protein